jgi:hypothetical protein
MTDPAAKLRQMRDSAPDVSNAIANSIAQIDAQVSELTDQANAIEIEVMDVDQTALISYLEITKVPQIEVIYGSSVEVSYGPTFGTRKWSPKGNISDWAIIDSTSGIPVYVYNGVGWDGDVTIDELITDYAFGNDYLYRPLVGSGLGSEASYGIYPTISNLEIGKGYLEENKTKVDDSVDVFTRYIS